jgi:hypothetical protein
LKTTSLQAYEFSDFHKTGKVDLTDILSATGLFGQGCTTFVSCYFTNPQYSTGLQSQCATGQTAPCVDISTIDTIATYYGHGLTGPFTGGSTGLLTATPPSALVNYDLNVDPFTFSNGAGSSVYYEGAIFTFSGSVRTGVTVYSVDPGPQIPNQIYVLSNTNHGGQTPITITADGDGQNGLHYIVCQGSYGAAFFCPTGFTDLDAYMTYSTGPAYIQEIDPSI